MMSKGYPVYEENLVVLPCRVFPSIIKKIDKVLSKDREGLFENRSHFVRCAINNFLNSERVDALLFPNKSKKR